ncbi:hypothetical protein GGR51DRAFT_557212 [Nemania sp. FL0031]|nr:hypothetical protein GGR51DRAFT_557212 [Nemania sp. FL0031]
MIASCLWILFLIPYVWGNTEKTIFLGPSSIKIESTYPTLEYSRLIPLNPDNFAIRTHLKAEFPSDEARHGKPSWFVLRNLNEGQRYEVRVCWAATQPTEFTLEAYDLQTVFRTPELASELSAFAATRQANMEHNVALSSQRLELGVKESILLLRIVVAADFYTTNHTLMKNIPPVFVDIILDPFILNVLPRSLLYTVTYIILVTIVSWFTGKWISSWVCLIAAEPTKQKYQ